MNIIRIKKNKTEKNKNKIMFGNDLQDIIIEWCYYTFIMF